MAPCTWPISYSACGSCSAFAGIAPADQATFEQMATDFLWRWTGKRFGVCPVVLRPCRGECSDFSTFWGRGPYPFPFGGGTSWPVLLDGEWYNMRSCGCAGACSCDVPEGLQLPGPVSAVTEVRIDGAVVSPGAYRLDGDLLIRTDGLGWPTCQNLALPAGEVGTWSISYDRGQDVPTGGRVAAGVLACELAKAACSDASCRLPQRIQTITRQGVTVAMLDPFTGLDKGYTGIWLIDSWLTSIVAAPRASQVYSVDVQRSRGRLNNL